MMNWNKEPIPFQVALQIGWNLPMDVVGAGVYGGIAKRDANGKVIIGDEWPEDNRAPPAHNPVHSVGPYLDFSKFTPSNRGYTAIARMIQRGNVSEIEALFQSIQAPEEKKKLANLVMTGGARPLHMCGMGRGGDTSEIIKVLVANGADVNAKDNYEYTPMDRLASNCVSGNAVLRSHGGVNGRKLPRGVPQWDSDEFAYLGPGNVHDVEVN
eukprot:TRINITY_DN67729_c0_g1_i1.p1 TRINITY_DN67729_c0_g1~~TRINITY_DN67729_c0_g1_i1.p1  ORF type:complete len:225 (-),score=26.92 TRINITY_DN67729_c0_g1_i1:175-810(-)